MIVTVVQWLVAIHRKEIWWFPSKQKIQLLRKDADGLEL